MDVGDGFENLFQLELGIFHVGVEKVLRVEKADEVVFLQVVDGQAGEVVRGKQTIDLGVAVRNVAGDHIDAGCQDFLDTDVVEFDGGLDEVAFVAVDGTFRLHFVHHDLHLCLRHGWGSLFAGNVAVQLFLELAEEEIDWREEPRQQEQGAAGRQQYLFRKLLGKTLGGNFPENQNNDGGDDGGHGDALGAHKLDEDDRGDGGGGDVDDIVAHENRRQDGIEVLQQFQAQLGPFLPFAGHVFEADLVDAGQGRLGRREKGRAGQEGQQDGNIGGESSFFHSGFLSVDYY